MKKQNQAAARASKPSPVQVRQDGYTFSGELAQNIQALAAERGVSPDAIVEQALEAFAAAKPKVELDGDLGEVVNRLGRVQGKTPQAAFNQIAGPAVEKFAAGTDDESDFSLPPVLAARMEKEPEFEDHMRVEIQLPADVLEKARFHAYHSGAYISDYVCNLLELDHFREEKGIRTHWEEAPF